MVSLPVFLRHDSLCRNLSDDKKIVRQKRIKFLPEIKRETDFSLEKKQEARLAYDRFLAAMGQSSFSRISESVTQAGLPAPAALPFL